MKKYILFIFLLISVKLFAQIPEDAIRYSWYTQNGTARNMAIGGVMGSLGGDLMAAYVNPAGLGFYKTNDFIFTPGYFSTKNSATFRQAETLGNKNGFSLGASGLILGFPSRHQEDKSNAICFAINQTANFRNEINYKSLNNYSSFAEQFAEELSKSGQPVSNFLFTNSTAPFSIAPAWNSYLIDTIRVNGALQVRAATERILDSGQALQQEMTRKTSGGIYEPVFSFAESVNKKWLWGLTVGLPFVYYKSNSTFTEQDTSANSFNGFQSFSIQDNFKTTGIGLNLKLGAIYRPKEYLRFGLAIHTPSYYLLKDVRTVNINTVIESDSGKLESYTESSNNYSNNQSGEARYIQNTPWKFIVSGSYVFREVQDTRKQRGFISADIEYINHRGSRFNSNSEVTTSEEIDYNKALNKVVKNEFKGTFNFKLGGEIKFNTIMTRLGIAYYGNPYKDKALKGNHLLLSGGLGYRNKGFFIDLTYVYTIANDINFPYRLEDRANTFATLNQQRMNIVASFGIKF